MADLAISEFSLSENWLERHSIRPETEEQNLKEAMRGALLRLMMDEAHFEGARITGRLEELAEDPYTSENLSGRGEGPAAPEDVGVLPCHVAGQAFQHRHALNPAKEDLGELGAGR